MFEQKLNFFALRKGLMTTALPRHTSQETMFQHQWRDQAMMKKRNQKQKKAFTKRFFVESNPNKDNELGY